MSITAKITTLLFVAGILAACGQQEEPAPPPPPPVIEPEPTYSKF